MLAFRFAPSVIPFGIARKFCPIGIFSFALPYDRTFLLKRTKSAANTNTKMMMEEAFKGQKIALAVALYFVFRAAAYVDRFAFRFERFLSLRYLFIYLYAVFIFTFHSVRMLWFYWGRLVFGAISILFRSRPFRLVLSIDFGTVWGPLVYAFFFFYHFPLILSLSLSRFVQCPLSFTSFNFLTVIP